MSGGAVSLIQLKDMIKLLSQKHQVTSFKDHQKDTGMRYICHDKSLAKLTHQNPAAHFTHRGGAVVTRAK